MAGTPPYNKPMTSINLRSEPRRKPPAWVVFSDLDGALLDEKTFERSNAKAQIERLQQAGIPLMFVSGKTREEITTLCAQLGNPAPFAAEYGAVVVRPRRGDIVLGRRVDELEQAAAEIRDETGAEIELLSRMTRHRAMEVTGLPDCQLGPARRRSHSAPFLLENGTTQEVHHAARRHGLRLVPDGPLLHLIGDHDKGDAVRVLREQHPNAGTIGVGAQANDLPLLKAVDRGVFVGPKRPSRLPPSIGFESTTGPTAWSRAVWSSMEPATLRVVGRV